MTGNEEARVSVELTGDEAKLIIAALRQFQPYWPAEMDDLSRADLLAGIRVAMDNVTGALQPHGDSKN